VRRFWKAAEAIADDDGWSIHLDGSPVRTPARALLSLPTLALAQAIAAEWDSAGETVDPRAMPFTGLANVAVDLVAPDRVKFAAGLSAYGESDLACYRTEGPEPLVERQSRSWDKLLAWARRRYDVDFATTAGILHVPQPASTVERLRHEVAVLGPFELAGLSPLVTVGGSLIAALALFEEALTPEQAWEAVSIDERWQLEQWGSDTEAEAALANRRCDFLAAGQFLELLRQP
jgi:chaperone required for assembly of F1-ATPase